MSLQSKVHQRVKAWTIFVATLASLPMLVVADEFSDAGGMPNETTTNLIVELDSEYKYVGINDLVSSYEGIFDIEFEAAENVYSVVGSYESFLDTSGESSGDINLNDLPQLIIRVGVYEVDFYSDSNYRIEAVSGLPFTFFNLHIKHVATYDHGDIIYQTELPPNEGDREYFVEVCQWKDGVFKINGEIVSLPSGDRTCHFEYGMVNLLLKVDLEWISKDETNNPLDVNPNEGGGERYYPGKRLPSESDPRNLVTLKVSVPGLAGKQVKLKAFDVDDPTKSAFNFNADEIDTNGDAGNDNFSDGLSTPQSGQFVLNSATSTTATVTLDDDGEAEIDFQVGMQPGNNYRVVAVIKDVEGNFDQLQVTDASGDAFVSADDDAISGFTGAGAASPMLTVWRKLHIEQDSMGAVPSSGSQKNFEEGAIAAVNPIEINPGVWGTEVDLGRNLMSYANDEFIKGRLEVSGETVYNSNGMPIHEVTDFYIGTPNIPGASNEHATVTVMGTLDASAVGKTFKLYDDDERGLPSSHQPLLPRFDLVADAVSQKYTPAYITVIDADTLGLNPNKTVNFEKHNGLNNLLPNVANNAEDLSSYADDEDFWSLLVTAVYQGSIGEDHDPDTETPALEGALLENLLGASPAFAVIFMEGIREDAWTALNSRSPSSVQNGQQVFINRIADVVAHEIGHAPAGSATGDEHDEGGLMGSGIQGADFRAESVARFRKAQTWR